MIERLKAWLQLGRAQTYPADLLLVMVPFMMGSPNLLQILTVSVLMFFVHWSSFGENSVLDFTQGYDKTDSAKSHHPLCDGRINVTSAINVMHTTKALSAVAAIFLIVLWSPNPTMAMAALFLWYAFGTAYNAGLSKETIFGFVPIMLCFMAMGAWGWFLTHAVLDTLGWAYIFYSGTVILFQIAWSGNLKDIEQHEKSNLLEKLGARIHVVNDRGLKRFYPGFKATLFGLTSKCLGITALLILCFVQSPLGLDKIIWTALMISGMFIMMGKLLIPRYWDKPKELRNMSLMEIFSIFAPVGLLLDWVSAGILLTFALGWFYLANKWMWGTKLYPKV